MLLPISASFKLCLAPSASTCDGAPRPTSRQSRWEEEPRHPKKLGGHSFGSSSRRSSVRSVLVPIYSLPENGVHAADLEIHVPWIQCMRDSFRRDPIPCHPRHPFPKSLEEETKPPTWLIHAVEICDFFFLSLFPPGLLHSGYYLPWQAWVHLPSTDRI